jgi:hypothetical protein
MISSLRTAAVVVSTVVGLALGAPALLFATSDVALAQEEGIPVEIRVLDLEGNPIPTAVVRHPEEQYRHPVNTVTGAYRMDVLYLPDGSEMVFAKGMELEFEISAPGYVTANIVYIVRKRKNVVVVSLEKMELNLLDDIEDPVIQFGRDRPIDGATADPSQ